MKTVLDLSSLVVRAQGHFDARLDEAETVLLDSKLENYFGLGRVGSRVWDLVAIPTTIAQVCATLQDEFEVDRQTCESQVLDLMLDLLEHSLIERLETPSDG